MASIFSKIVAGEIPSHKIAENDKFYAFLDINPLVMGHVLVIPKQEIDYIFDIADGDLAEMIVFAKHIAVCKARKIFFSRILSCILLMRSWQKQRPRFAKNYKRKRQIAAFFFIGQIQYLNKVIAKSDLSIIHIFSDGTLLVFRAN